MTYRHHAVGSIGLYTWLLASTTAALVLALSFSLKQTYSDTLKTTDSPQTAEYLLNSLPDGAYQFCTEPAPTDWRDGAGACLNVMKQGTTLNGYYGYPHTESFVCLHGDVSGDWLYGNGFVISWPGHPWPEIPQQAFLWDQKGRLTLADGAVTRTEGNVSWITFQQADLNMARLHLYPTPRMNRPAQLCDWRSTEAVSIIYP